MSKRELVDTGSNKHFARRDGRVRGSAGLGKSLSADSHKAKHNAKSGEEERGNHYSKKN
jgi:hypothetical protein